MRNTLLLQDAIEVVKSFGYKCFYPQYKHTKYDKPIYCYITDGTNIGYMELNHWGFALNFSSVHKPSKENGMGCMVAEDISLNMITKELIKETFGTPNWIKIKPIKYASWEDYLTNSLTGKLIVSMVEL